MSEANVPAASKAEVPSEVPAKAEVPTDIQKLQDQLAESQARAEKAERAFSAAQRKGKTADELQAQLEKREEEFAQQAKELEKREKLFRQTLKPRLEALPEHTRKLVELAGKDGAESLIAALELAEKDARPAKHDPQGGALPSQNQGASPDWDSRWDKALKAR